MIIDSFTNRGENMEVWQKLKLFSTGFIERVEQSFLFLLCLSLSQISSEE